MQLKNLVSLLAASTTMMATLAAHSVPLTEPEGTESHNIKPLLENLIQKPLSKGGQPNVTMEQSLGVFNFESGHLRADRWYDFSCKDHFSTTCYSDPQYLLDRIYIKYVCNSIDQDFFIPRILLKDVDDNGGHQYQFKSVGFADLLIGIPVCAMREALRASEDSL